MNLLHILSIMSVSFTAADALKCYECKYCDDIFKTVQVRERDCDESFETPSCEKLVVELSNSTKGVLLRRCQHSLYLVNTKNETGLHTSEEYSFRGEEYIQAYYLELGMFKNVSKVYTKRVIAHHCGTDFCNSTQSVPTSLPIILATTTYILLIFLIF